MTRSESLLRRIKLINKDMFVSACERGTQLRVSRHSHMNAHVGLISQTDVSGGRKRELRY